MHVKYYIKLSQLICESNRKLKTQSYCKNWREKIALGENNYYDYLTLKGGGYVFIQKQCSSPNWMENNNLAKQMTKKKYTLDADFPRKFYFERKKKND